nr:methyltransferase domain-containing protein [Deinobacterium chartae]
MPGLEPFLKAELQRLPGSVRIFGGSEDALRLGYSGRPRDLHRLRTATAVFRRHTFAVPRPKALMGHQVFQELLAFLDEVRQEADFGSFRFDAAGRESSTFLRLGEELERATGMRFDPEEGELLMRLRPRGEEAWEMLARTTPRPLSARPWRVRNMSGGLNAAVAVAMLRMAGVRPTDRVLNAMCGSGTLLVERALMGEAERIVGVDIDPEALEMARENLAAAKRQGQVELRLEDATALADREGSYDVIVADVPWGDAIGEHAANAQLYRDFLEEAWRVGSKAVRLVVLTHELRLFEGILEASRWRLDREVQVFHGGHRPKMYLLRK